METEKPNDDRLAIVGSVVAAATWVLSWVWYLTGQALSMVLGGETLPRPSIVGPIEWLLTPPVQAWPQPAWVTTTGVVVIVLAVTGPVVFLVGGPRLLSQRSTKREAHQDLYFLGTEGRQKRWSNAEDTVVMFGGPRSGKTSRWAMRWIAESIARGWPPLTTSNKPDIADALRASEPDTYVLDFSRVSAVEGSATWDIFGEIGGPADARRIATELIPMRAGEKQPFFTNSARLLVTVAALHTARTNGSIDDFARHISSARRLREIVSELRDPADRALVDQAKGLLANDSVETIGNVISTLVAELGWLGDPNVMAAVRPREGASHLSARRWLETRDHALVVLCADGQASGRELSAAFLASIFYEAGQLANRQIGGRLNPPLPVVLDEAANIARIQNLPDLMSHFGSRGILLALLFQSMAQVKDAWGAEGGNKIIGASNHLLLTAGLTDETLGKLGSELGGQTLVRQVSRSHGRNGATKNVGVGRKAKWTTGEIAEIPRGKAILYSTGQPAADIQAPNFWKKR